MNTIDAPSAMPGFVGPAAPSLAFAACVACSWATAATELACTARQPRTNATQIRSRSILSCPIFLILAAFAANLELANYPDRTQSSKTWEVLSTKVAV